MLVNPRRFVTWQFKLVDDNRTTDKDLRTTKKMNMEWWEAFKEWFLSLGETYGVNPFIFGGIYLGAIPFFILSLGWTVKNIRRKRSFVLPALLTGLFFISAYLYLIIAGKNIPAWVYVVIGLMVVYGVYSTINKIKGKTKKEV